MGSKPKDIIEIPTTCNGMGEKTPHPTQKPEELVRKYVLAASTTGELVVDPFSGSGTTAVVATQLGRRFKTCDLSTEYNTWAAQRLEVATALFLGWNKRQKSACLRKMNLTHVGFAIC